MGCQLGANRESYLMNLNASLNMIQLITALVLLFMQGVEAEEITLETTENEYRLSVDNQPLSSVLSTISSDSGITFSVPEHIGAESITIDIVAEDWQGVAKQLLRPYNTALLWDKNGKLHHVRLLEQGQQNSVVIEASNPLVQMNEYHGPQMEGYPEPPAGSSKHPFGVKADGQLSTSPPADELEGSGPPVTREVSVDNASYSGKRSTESSLAIKRKFLKGKMDDRREPASSH